MYYLPPSVLFDRALSPKAKLTYAYLTHVRSVRAVQIQKALDITYVTIRDVLRQLREGGHLSWTKDDRTYHFTFPTEGRDA